MSTLKVEFMKCDCCWLESRLSTMTLTEKKGWSVWRRDDGQSVTDLCVDCTNMFSVLLTKMLGIKVHGGQLRNGNEQALTPEGRKAFDDVIAKYRPKEMPTQEDMSLLHALCARLGVDNCGSVIPPTKESTALFKAIVYLEKQL